jgi:YD repeat-containing protein
MTSWPRQSDVLAYRSPYGDPRGRSGGVASSEWERANLTMIVPPYPMVMGAIPITRIRIHKHCAQSLLRVLQRIKNEAMGDIATLRAWGATEFGGAYNYRVMRGLSTLSMHAFGCAIDLDPARNGFGDATPNFAGVPQVLNAFRAEGWTWGGDWDGDGDLAEHRRPDGMHWQATAPVG